jgi:ADP-ribosyl-[dinitrogen reductase] hydrolase
MSEPTAASPHPPLRHCYWVVPGLLLAGEHPGGPTRDKTKDRLKKLLAAGIECFVDLTKPTELLRYDTHLPFYVEYTRKAIKDHGLPASREQMAEILDYVGNAMRAGRPVYVHCRAGIGRTGTVIGCLLVERGLSGDGALDELNRLWQQSKRSKNWAFVPETEAQANYIREWKRSLDNGGFEMNALATGVDPRPGALSVAGVQSRAASQSTGAGQARAAMQNLAAGKGRTGAKTSGANYAAGAGLAAAAAQARAAVERGEGATQSAGAGFANGAGLSAAASRARAAVDRDKASHQTRVADNGIAAGHNGAGPGAARAGRASAGVPAVRMVPDSPLAPPSARTHEAVVASGTAATPGLTRASGTAPAPATARAPGVAPARPAPSLPRDVVPTSTETRPFAALLDQAGDPPAAASHLAAAGTAQNSSLMAAPGTALASPGATALGAPALRPDVVPTSAEERPFAALMDTPETSPAEMAPGAEALPPDEVPSSTEVRPFAALLDTAEDPAPAVAPRPAVAGTTMAQPRARASSPPPASGTPKAVSPAIERASSSGSRSARVPPQVLVPPSNVTPSVMRAPSRHPTEIESRPDVDPLLDTATLAAARALRERFVGTLFGLAVGDAVAAPTQFRRAGSFSPVGDMVGGGPFDLPRGAWSDDTAMALCLAESLLERDGFDPRDQVQRYARWQQDGYLSCTGQCVGITASTARSLALAKWRRVVFPGSFDPEQLDPEPLSRVAPIALYYLASLETTLQQAAESSRTTCQAPAVLDACRELGRALNAALSGQPKARILADVTPITEAAAHMNNTAATALAAAFWAFSSTDNFRDAVLRAANVGGNSDVVASVCGQLAGAHYGMSAIPPSWRNGLMQKDLIEGYADRLLAHGLVSLSR